jgi:hypothetical protein
MVSYPYKKKTLGLITCFLFLCIVGYGLFQARNLIAGPQISLITPIDGSAVANSLVTISGKAHNISFISLNDRPIFIDQQGNFNEQLVLSPGYNVWTLMAKDKFGRTVSKQFSLVLSSS